MNANQLLRAIFGLAKGADTKTVYMLQHGHCGHVAATSDIRANMVALHTTAFRLGFHGWRVRTLGTTEDLQSTCDKCEAQKKVLNPSSKKAAKKAAA